MDSELFVDTLVTKSLEILPEMARGERYFEGYLTIEMKDRQGEITLVDELYKVLPIWVDRGAPITDTHSNRVIGKGINFARAVYKDTDGTEYPAIKITGKIHKNYELDDDIWEKIKSGEYKGLSFGGATKSDRKPRVMKDGTVAYELKDLEHYEVAVCKDPAVPLALITDYNALAKAAIPAAKDRGDGKMVIQCDKFKCYVVKSETEDIKKVKGDFCPSCGQKTPKKSPEQQSLSVLEQEEAKDISTEEEDESDKVTKSEGADEPEYNDESIIPVEKHHTDEPHTHKCGNKNEMCLKCDPEKKKFDKDFSNADLTTALYTQNVDEGGMGKDGKPKKDETYIKVASTATSGTGGGVRGIPNEAYNQTAPNDQTVQNTELEDSGDKIEEDDNSDNKMIARVGDEMSPEKGLDIGQTDRRQDNTKLASGFRTEDNNNKLGDERGDSNAIKEDETDIKLASDFCPNCGKEITESQHKDYPETQAKGAYCPTCRQNKQIKDRDIKDDIKMESITAGIHRDLAARGQKVTRFSAGKKPKTFN